MKTVLFSAPVLTQSGYGVHAQQVFQYLLNAEKQGRIKLHVQVVPWGDTSWHVNPANKDGLIGEVMKRTVPPLPKYDVSLQLKLPNEWSTAMATYNVGMTAGVETDRCNPEWVTACNKMQLVIVPSEHSLKSIKKSGTLLTPSKVVPEAFPVVYSKDVIEDVDFGFDTPFNFLVFGQLTGNNPENDRKNIFYTIKWLCDTFAGNKDVGIVVKTNGGKSSHFDRSMMKNVFTTLLKEVRQTSEFPKVHLLHGDMTDNEVHALMHNESIKALVALTRGEGFGLPILEAAAAGLPVVATNWSAHTEFLGLGKYIDIDSRLVEIHPSRVDNQIFMKDSKWAAPSEECFKRKIKKLHSNYEAPKRWASELKPLILENYNIQTIMKKYDDVLKGII
jgi:glycosyltransferase involved in cell wall biosynthesis